MIITLKLENQLNLRDGKDITIFCCGAMVYNSLEAANLLEKKIYLVL